MSMIGGYQGGPYLELFTAQGKNPTSNWKVTGSGVKKVYDEEVKSYLYLLEGSTTTNKMLLPKDPKHNLALVQKFLVFQIYLHRGQEFTIELTLTDLGGNKRRLFLSTAQREIKINPLHAKLPISCVKRAIWNNLCLDLCSLVSEIWRNQTFKTAESITVSANCKLRRVFTMRSQPIDTSGEDRYYGDCVSMVIEQIPKQCLLSPDVHQLTQVLTMQKIKVDERLKAGDVGANSHSNSLLDLDLTASGQKAGLPDSYHIAFGTKVPLPVSSRKSVRESVAANTNRSARSINSRCDSDVELSSRLPSNHRNQLQSPGSNLSLDVSTVDRNVIQSHHGTALSNLTASEKENTPVYQPHPPHEASKDRFKRRFRVRSAEKAPDLRTGSGNDTPKSGPNESRTDPHALSIIPPILRSEEPLSSTPKQQPRSRQSGAIQTGQADESLQSDKTPTPQHPVHMIPTASEVEDSVLDLIGLLKNSSGLINDTAHSDEGTDGLGHQEPGEYSDSDDDILADDHDRSSSVFLFASPPAAPRQNISPFQADTEQKASEMRKPYRPSSYKSDSGSVSSRGARPEDDFFDSVANSDEDGDNDSDDDEEDEGDSIVYDVDIANCDNNNNKGFYSGVNARDLPSRSTLPIDGGSAVNTPDIKITAGQNHGNGNPNIFVPTPEKNMNSKLPKFHGDVPRLSLNPIQSLDGSPRLKGGFNFVGHRSVSVNRKHLRKLTDDDVRLSQRSYDYARYQPADLLESQEAEMLASFKRQQDMEDDQCRDHIAMVMKQVKGQESPITSDEEETSSSTWKVPPENQGLHNYQDEMSTSQLSTDTLTSSNPRDWNSVFSPPIMSSGELTDKQNKTAEMVSEDKRNGSKSAVSKVLESDDELDLMYDPCLDCYYDPKTSKYYELK